ncbi:MAG TPA: ABC transporter ATP-binding protein [Longimicrobiales bacterium]|nr:ABC transporter ATP-binding protein [Longimicrobiales bacterium]
MIRVRGLNKRFGRLQVLRDLDLEIEPSRVTAILGPNGAGKTTLIKSILGLVKPDAGEIRVGGVRVNGDGAYRRDIGYMPQIPRYPENLTVEEILHMIQDLRGQFDDLDTELVDAFDLGPQLRKPFKHLSGGTRQRVSAVIAFLFRPRILFLDEPTAGLDPVASSALKDKILRERAAGRTIVLTSHVMSEVEELADMVVYILDGTVQFEESVTGLLERTGEPNLERAMARMMLRVVA